jgi:G3E family GTPase
LCLIRSPLSGRSIQEGRSLAILEPLFGTIIVGFLGAGKTTLLHHLIHGNHGLRIAVLVEEPGAVNIDLQFIADADGRVVPLANGCCCFLLDNNLPEIIESLQKQPIPPDYLIVEAAGVLRPREIVAKFKQHTSSRVQIDSVIAVVDVEQIRKLEGHQAQVAQQQIQEADFVILNKIDLIPSFTLAAVKRWLEQIAPGIRTFETSFGQIPLDLLVGIGEYLQLIRLQRNSIYAHIPIWNHPFHATPPPDRGATPDVRTAAVFQTWTYTSTEPYDYPSLYQVLIALPDSIYRVKGTVRVANSNRLVQIQIAGQRGSLRLSEVKTQPVQATQIVVVGLRESMDCDFLFQLFESCRLRETQTASSNQPLSNYEWNRFQT